MHEKKRVARREFLKAAAGTGLAMAGGSSLAQSFAFTPNQRYPDPSLVILDPSFTKYRIYSSTVEQVATGMRWAEGPVYFPEGGYVLVSDIPNNRIMKFDEKTGAFTVFRANANYANGNTRDRQGRLVTCEHSVTRRVTRTEKDGKLTVLADSFDGKRLNAPNDVVVRSDDSLWFTDPIFGINGEWEGTRAKPEQATTNVYRIGTDGKVTAVITDLVNPNGLAFSPDEKVLYVVECATPRTIHAYDVVDAGRALRNRRIHIDAGAGTPDGFRVDMDGNLWCGWGMGSEALDGVRIFAPDGKPIGHIHLPERCANACFGGEKRNRLLMAASQSVYSLYVNTQGAPYF